MMNQYESMLNLTFEIEGLISLLQRRDDEGVKEVKTLLESKVKALYQSLVCQDINVNAELQEITEVPGQPNQSEVSDEMEISEVVEPTHVEPIIEESDIPVVDAVATTSLPVFTLNDKFRFKRELFANSEADFVDTLNVLSAMSSYEEAEDYLYNDLCWDSSSDEVAEFMTVIKDYFDKR